MTTPELLQEWKALCDAIAKSKAPDEFGSSAWFQWQADSVRFYAAARTAMPRLIEALEYIIVKKDYHLQDLDDCDRVAINRILTGGHPMTAPKKPALKPCPFCGAIPRIINAGDSVAVECQNVKCKLFVSTCRPYELEYHAVAAWNRRAK